MTSAESPLPHSYECVGFAHDCDCRRCEIARAAWAERPRLLALARCRLPTCAEADDVVSEAITRALECPLLDPERVAAWLTTVTIHICVDRARERSHAPKRWRYAVQEMTSNEFETDLIETLAAAEIAPLLGQLPHEQSAALWLRADGESIASIATFLSVSEKAAESLLSRARVAARAIVGAVASVLAVACATVRRPVLAATPAAAVAAVIAMVTVPSMPWNSSAHMHPGTSVGPLPSGTRLGLGPLIDEGPSALIGPSAANADQPVRGPLLHGYARPPRTVHAKFLTVHDGGSGYEDQQQSFVDSVKQCIEKGIVITPSYIGCKTLR